MGDRHAVGTLWCGQDDAGAGHGRRGRPWQTAEGNLAASLLLSIPAGLPNAAMLGFAAGLALADRITIEIKGKGGHAALPHLTIDPIVVGAQIITALQTIVGRNVSPVDEGVVTISNFDGGTGASNIIADKAVMIGTIRAFKRETRELMHIRVQEIATGVAQALGATAEVEIDMGYDPTINTDHEVDLAAEAASIVVGAENVDIEYEPTMGAEDFGAYLSHKPGAFIVVGQATSDPNSRHNQGLHTPRYDFNDEILPVGISWFVKLVENYMPLGK